MDMRRLLKYGILDLVELEHADKKGVFRPSLQ
jgi:hypothetical protein